MSFNVQHSKTQFRKCYDRYGDLIKQYDISFSLTLYCNPKLDSVTITPQPIKHFTDLMTVIRSLSFAKFRVVSSEHLQWAWHAKRERLPFRTPGSDPFRALQIFRLLIQVFPNLPRFSWLFIWNIHRSCLESLKSYLHNVLDHRYSSGVAASIPVFIDLSLCARMRYNIIHEVLVSKLHRGVRDSPYNFFVVKNVHCCDSIRIVQTVEHFEASFFEKPR